MATVVVEGMGVDTAEGEVMEAVVAMEVVMEKEAMVVGLGGVSLPLHLYASISKHSWTGVFGLPVFL